MKYISKESTDVTEIVVVELNGAKYRRISYKTASEPLTWQRHILTFHGYKWEPLFASGCDLEVLWRHANGLGAESPAAKTVKVRVAVAVASNGTWNTGGADGGNDESSADEAMEFMPESLPTQIYWLTAELPIPQSVEIPATIQPS